MQEQKTKSPGLMLEVRADGLSLPEPPKFANAQEERADLKLRLAASLRIFSMHGFDAGIAGHISARDPLLPDHFWVNPLAVHFSRVKVSDLVLVNHAGEVVEGSHPVNAAAFAIHSRIHAMRPDVAAAAHSHSRYGTAFATLGRLLPPISQEACAFYQDHAVLQAYHGIAGEVSEGDLIARALGDGKGLICRNHGHFTVGQTLEAAVFWFIRMERACEQYLLTRDAQPVEVDHETALLTRKQVGSPRAGWFGLQPLMDKVLAETPDLRD